MKKTIKPERDNSILKKIRKTTKVFVLIEILSIFLLSLTPVLWLQANKIILGHDSGFRIDPSIHLYDLFFSWNPKVNFGIDWSIFKGFLIGQFPELFFTQVTNSVHLGQILTMVFWFFGLGFSMYIFSYAFFPQKKYWLIRLVSSFLYMFNFFVLQAWFIAERGKFSLMIALPLMIVILYRVFTRHWSLWKGGVLFGIVFAVFNGGSSPPLYGAILLAFFLTVSVLTLINIKQYGLKDSIFTVKAIGVMGIFSILLSAYWIVPQVYLALHSYSERLSGHGGIEGLLQWEAVVSKYASMINLLRLQGVPDWYDNPYHPYSNDFITNPYLLFLSFLPFILIVAGMFFYQKFEKNYKKPVLVLLLLVVLVCGLFFAAGSHPPFGVVYTQLIKYVPGFAIFRSAIYKFGPLIWFSVAFLSAYFLYGLTADVLKKNVLRYAVYFIGGVYLVLFSLPYVTSDFFQWHKHFSTRLEVPSYVYQMATYVNEEAPQSKKILLLPPLQNGVDKYTWGFWSLDILPRLFMNRPIVANDAYTVSVIDQLYELLGRNSFANVNQALTILGVDSILYRKDVIDEEHNFDSRLYESSYTQLFENAGLRKEKEYGEWVLYTMDTIHNPLFSTPQSLISVSSDTVPLFSTLQALGDPNKAVLISRSELEDKPVYKDLVSHEVIQAECLICTPGDIRSIEEAVSLPQPRILPGALAYPLQEKNERELLKQSEANTSSYIDTNLSIATAKLAEIRELLIGVPKDTTRQAVRDTVTSYNNYIGNIRKSIEKLEGMEKERYQVRIYGYLRAHMRYLQSLSHSFDAYPGSYEIILGSLTDSLERLNEQIDYQQNQKHYIFSLPHDGLYTFSLPSIASQASVLVDERALETRENVLLSAGFHKLVIKDIPLETDLVLPLDFPQGERMVLEYKKPRTITFDTASLNGPFLVDIEVEDIQGVNPTVFINDWYTSADKQILLNQQEEIITNQKNFVTVAHTPHELATYVSVTLEMDGYPHETSEFTLTHIDITPYENQDVFILNDVNKQTMVNAEVQKIQSVSPTLHSVEISNTQGPFLFSFNQRYNPGWYAYIMPKQFAASVLKIPLLFITGKQIPQDNHVTVNSYANGWLINEQGEYTVVVWYMPQMYFYLGLVISAFSFTAIIIVVVIRKVYSQRRKTHEKIH